MKELLKSFGYTLVGCAAVIAIVFLICVSLDALTRVSPRLQHAVLATAMLMVITAIVHLIRTGK